MNNIIRTRLTFAAVFMILSFTPAHAALIEYTDLAAWTTANGPATGTEDFNSFTTDTTFISTSVTANNMIISGEAGSNGTQTNKIDASAFEFGDNYVQDGSSYLLGDLMDAQTIRIDFMTAVSAWGGFFRFISDGGRDTRVRAFSSTDTLLGEVSTFSSDSQFFGFGLTSGLASYLEIQNFTSSNDVFGIDDISFVTTSPVPEPGTLALLGAGLLGFGIMTRRRRAV